MSDEAVDPRGLSRREFVVRMGGFLTPIHLVESLKLTHCTGPSVKLTESHDIKEFDCKNTLLKAFGRDHRVYCRGDEGPAVIVLHELPGMTPSDIDFAFRLSEQHFRVYLPLLFGEPGDDKFGRHLLSECVFGRWPWEELEPVNPWVAPLLNLVDTVAQQTGGNIGVIGMCLTGMMPVSLMASSHVVAPVVSQPTNPLPIDRTRSASLGLPPAEIMHARNRLESENLHILAFRAATDCLCPAARFDTLCATFPDRVLRNDVDFGTVRGHSILASEFHKPNAPHGVNQAFDDTVKFLQARLRS